MTSRRVAERIGVKQRLVYYYFRTTDDLIVATIQRLAALEMKRLGHTLDLKHPLREIWDVCIHTADARLIAEFTALVNRNKRLGKEVITFIKASRAIQVQALTAALKRAGRRSRIPAAGLALLATSVALSLTRESVLGVHTGHSEIKALIGQFLADFDP